MKKNKLILALMSVSLVGASMTGCSELKHEVGRTIRSEVGRTVRKTVNDKVEQYKHNKPQGNQPQTDTADIADNGNFADTASKLVEQDFKSGGAVDIPVNNNKSTLDIKTWDGPKIDYSDLDSLNRVGAATAYLDKKTLGKSAGRDTQVWKPTGWNNQAKKVDGKRLFPMNRGHLIAYTVTFNLTEEGIFNKGEKGSIDNPKNLFSQSAYSNQITFQKYEGMVRDSLAKNHKVIYRVQPLFKGNELMARGAWIQAISDDGSLNFNQYVHNVQPGLSFDYKTGRSKVDKSMTVEK